MNATGILLFALAQAATPEVTPPPAVPTQPLLPAPPADLSTLSELPLQRRWPRIQALSDYVRAEVRAGRCAAGANRLRVDLAVLVAADGQIRRVRPRAIQCPTVEQYASGLMLRMARGNVPAPGEERWFRAAVDFAWQ